jgi:DNA polymerase III sliding clamp (beta) subunit (PCNA family)
LEIISKIYLSISQTLTQRITVDRYRLSELLKEASLFDSSVSITIRNGEITIKDFEGNTEVVDTVSDTNANIVFGINSRVLLDFLASYNEDNVQIGFNGPNLPIMLIANPNYKEVAMPLVMQAETGVQDDESKAA